MACENLSDVRRHTAVEILLVEIRFVEIRVLEIRFVEIRVLIDRLRQAAGSGNCFPIDRLRQAAQMDRRSGVLLGALLGSL